MKAMAIDPRIDAYIARQADFARPILSHLRDLIHTASPEIREAVKWGMPFFTYRGRNLCNMAGFKAHVAFGFWGSSAACGALMTCHPTRKSWLCWPRP